MKKPRNRRIAPVILVLILVVAAFAYGVGIATFNVFPYPLLDSLARRAIGRETQPEAASSQQVLDKLHRHAEVEVHFIDVGHGDAFVVLLEDGTAMMIDTGREEYAEFVVEYLNSLGVSQIDLLLITHYHGDHIGGAFAVVDSVRVKEVALPKYTTQTAEERKFIDDVIGDIPFNHVGAGDLWTFGDIELRVLGPMRKYESLDGYPAFYAANNNSIVSQLVSPAVTVLFMADAKTKAEMDLLSSQQDLRSDVLQVGHHGRYASTSHELLAGSNPEYAVISTNGRYPYAHKDVIRRLETLGCTILRTDIHGSIVLRASEDDYWFKVSQGEIPANE